MSDRDQMTTDCLTRGVRIFHAGNGYWFGRSNPDLVKQVSQTQLRIGTRGNEVIH